jgi:hypothetical protein
VSGTPDPNEQVAQAIAEIQEKLRSALEADALFTIERRKIDAKYDDEQHERRGIEHLARMVEFTAATKAHDAHAASVTANAAANERVAAAAEREAVAHERVAAALEALVTLARES